MTPALQALMLTTFGLLSLLVGSTVVSDRPRVEIWTDRGDDPYASGQGVRVHFRTEQDAYVTILRIDTDGRVRVLFPREPWRTTSRAAAATTRSPAATPATRSMSTTTRAWATSLPWSRATPSCTTRSKATTIGTIAPSPTVAYTATRTWRLRIWRS